VHCPLVRKHTGCRLAVRQHSSLPTCQDSIPTRFRACHIARNGWVGTSPLSGPAIAEWQLASPLLSSFMTRPNAAVVLVAGMGGGNTTGGMGAGTTGGMGGGSTPAAWVGGRAAAGVASAT
jgi:hypothetical protein